MATERRRHRRRGSDKPKGKKTSSREPAGVRPATVHDVPDHLLQLILLHLDSSVWLRVAATSRRWRRLVAEAAFLSRFRSVHGPCVAGSFHAVDPDWVEHGSPPITGNPVFVPSSSSSSLVVDSRRFSLDFLPDSDTGWEIADSRGSLLLLFKRRTSSWAARATRRSRYCFPDLVVCEPLTRRWQGILRPGLLAAVSCCLGVFLLDGDRIDSTSGGAGSNIGMSNFRIISVLHECNTSAEPGRATPVACVFSSGNDGGWRVLPKPPSSDISVPDAVESISFVGRANGSLYWVTGEDDAMLAFDESTAKFSRFLFPAGSIRGSFLDRSSVRVIGGDDGALRVIRVIGNDLKVFAKLQGSDEWVVEKLVRLSEATSGLPGREGRFFNLEALIVAANEKYVLMTPQGKTWLFSVELETLEVEREHERNRYPGAAYPCDLPWPPALEDCGDHGRRRQSRG